MIHLTIVTPESKLYDNEARRVTVRTTSGDVTILPRHIDYAAALGRGKARITTPDGAVKNAVINGGMLHVAKDDVQIITNDFEWQE